jgi:hypothetical protein
LTRGTNVRERHTQAGVTELFFRMTGRTAGSA